MKNNFNRVLAALLTGVVALSCVACSSSDSKSSSDTTGKTNDDASNDTSKSEIASAESDGEQITIRFQSWNPGELWMSESLIPDFEEKNPDKKIDFVYMPYSDHVEKLKIDLASGSGPDVFGAQTGAFLKEFRVFEMPLSSYAKEEWGDNWKENFNGFAIDLLDEDEEFYAMPLGLNYAGFTWADTTILDKYNLSIPTDLDTLQTTASVLRENQELPLVIGAKDDWINLDMWMSIANDINSEMLYKAIEGEVSFTEADIIESFQIWQSLFNEEVFQDGALGVNVYNDTSELFEQQQVVPLMCNGSWTVNAYLSSNEITYEEMNNGNKRQIFLIDWNNDGKVAPVTATVDVSLCINKESKNPDAAWAFVSYLITEGQEILVNKHFAYFPSISTIDIQVEGLSEDGIKNLDYIAEQGENNVAGYRENPYPQLKQSIADNLKGIATGEITPEQAAEAIQNVSEKEER